MERKAMFRPIRRKKKEMDIDAAKELLQCSRRGVLAVNGDDGYPYDEIDVMPRYVQYS